MIEQNRILDFIGKLKQCFESNPARKTITYTIGPKYIKVYSHYLNNPDSISIYCFIDADGNIYKPAGSKKPADGIRSNILTADLNRIDIHGAWLYRSK